MLLEIFNDEGRFTKIIYIHLTDLPFLCNFEVQIREVGNTDNSIYMMDKTDIAALLAMPQYKIIWR